jgi:hypothetical protein
MRKEPSKLMFWLCSIALIVAPLFNSNINKQVLTENSKGVINNTDIILTVTNKGVSNSGFEYCNFIVEKPIQKTYIGPCNTTNNTQLSVGFSYNVTKLDVKEGGLLSINKAVEIDNKTKIQVVEIKFLAGTKVAKLSNGNIVSASNVEVGDWVSVR